MTLSFMIRKKYLLAKVDEQEKTGTFIERRAYKPFWRSRIGSTHAWHLGGEAVFLCGRYAFIADIRNIAIKRTPDDIRDVVSSKVCYNIECRFLQSELEGLSVFLSL